MTHGKLIVSQKIQLIGGIMKFQKQVERCLEWFIFHILFNYDYSNLDNIIKKTSGSHYE